jgi:hypothetical protein
MPPWCRNIAVSLHVRTYAYLPNYHGTVLDHLLRTVASYASGVTHGKLLFCHCMSVCNPRRNAPNTGHPKSLHGQGVPIIIESPRPASMHAHEVI